MRIKRLHLDQVKNKQSNGSEKGLAATLGSFDGIHVGHRKVIDETLKIARENNLKSAVISFYPHPAVTLGKDPNLLKISSLRQTVSILTQLGVEELCLIRFTKKVSILNYKEFLSIFLIKYLNVKYFVIGEDAKVGIRAEGSSLNIKSHLEEFGVKCKICPLEISLENTSKFGSRSIRTELSKGRVDWIKNLLGRNYSVVARVVKGEGIGRTLGFPTLNLSKIKNCLLPNGIYICRCYFNDELQSRVVNGVANLGIRPTISSTEKRVLEVHLLDFNADLYKRKVEIEFLSKIRDELKFNSVDELKSRIYSDVILAKDYFQREG